VAAFQALEKVWVTLTWASARRLASAQAVTGQAFSPRSLKNADEAEEGRAPMTGAEVVEGVAEGGV